MRLDWTRRRAPIAMVVAIVATVLSLVSAATTREGVALSIAFDLAIACVTTLSLPDLKSSHPVVSRAALTLLALDVAIFITFFLNSSTNFNLATGAAMSIVLLGLSFLTGASGQISLGNGAFMGVGAFAMAIWSNHHATTPIFLTLLIAVACGALVGLLLGLPATRLRGPYLAGMTLAFLPSVAELPIYDADVEAAGVPDKVAALGAAIGAADGLIIVTPEYNYGVPGVLKNAVDWLSRPPGDATLRGRPIALMGASTGYVGTMRAQLAWRQMWHFFKCPVFSEAELTVAFAAKAVDESGALTDPAYLKSLDGYLEALAAWLEPH